MRLDIRTWPPTRTTYALVFERERHRCTVRQGGRRESTARLHGRRHHGRGTTSEPNEIDGCARFLIGRIVLDGVDALRQGSAKPRASEAPSPCRRRRVAVVFRRGTLLHGSRRFEADDAARSYAPTASTLSPEARSNLEAFLARVAGASMDMDPELGWAPIKNRDDINSAGMRDDHEYASMPAPGVLRIAAFGDSLRSDRRSSRENWAKRIPALARSIEVLNYGVPAYGLDQAYLRYLAVGAEYHPHIVLIGYMSREPRPQRQRLYRGFYSRAYRDAIFTKPRFKIENGSLTLVNNPLATIDAYRALRANARRGVARRRPTGLSFRGLYDAGPFDFSSDRFGAEIATPRAQGTAGADHSRATGDTTSARRRTQ